MKKTIQACDICGFDRCRTAKVTLDLPDGKPSIDFCPKCLGIILTKWINQNATTESRQSFYKMASEWKQNGVENEQSQ